jgi:N-methylhydantoinase A
MNSKAQYKLGVDIGGTFTDFTLIDTANDRITGAKISTIPLHPEEGIHNGLQYLSQSLGIDVRKIDYFVHGMTIGINTLLQRKGTNIALFVTDGFRDLLTMQRMRLPVSFDFHSRLPEPLVPRNRIFGIPERIDVKGNEIIPIDEAAVMAAVKEAEKQGVEGIAICFLHSYAYPYHEQQVAEIIHRIHPTLKLCLSSSLWPEIREYERACISVVNLYIQKNVEDYFKNLQQVLKSQGVTIEPFITQSNGGIMDLDSAANAPVKTLFSGPAGGVMGAIHEGRLSHKADLLTLDMGGTSTDVSVVLNYEPVYSQKCKVSGFPIMIPTIDVRTIGAGGGSIAWRDTGGMLRVGPTSAGSDPGPACYGKSHYPTVTDAFLLCGYLNSQRFAGGNFNLNTDAAEKAISSLAQQFDKTTLQLADQIIQIAISNMYVALSNILEEKGLDPRDLTIVAYGGGGPLVANFVAEEIHAKDILISHHPGTLCAMGALSANFTYDAVAPYHVSMNHLAIENLRQKYKFLHRDAQSWLDQQKTDVTKNTPSTFQYLLDARYCGQSYELQLTVTDTMLADESGNVLRAAFNDLHKRQYGHSEPDSEIEIISVRARVIACTPEINIIPELSTTKQQKNIMGYRKIFIKGKTYKAAIYQRESLRGDEILQGPAIIEQDDTTILILPGWTGTCEQNGNILIGRGGNKCEN